MKSILYKWLDTQYTVQINTNVLTMVTLGPPKVSMYESIIMYIIHTKKYARGNILWDTQTKIKLSYSSLQSQVNPGVTIPQYVTTPKSTQYIKLKSMYTKIKIVIIKKYLLLNIIAI